MELTIVAFVFVLILSIFIGRYHFYHTVENDKNILFNHSGNTENLVQLNTFNNLPDILVIYLHKVGVEGKCKDCHLTIRQRGSIRKDKNSKWLHFVAKQYLSVVPFGFVWAARSFPILVKDKSINGIGESKVSFSGLKIIGLEHSLKTNKSALHRCLSELPLYPVGFLNEDISLEVLGDNSLKVGLTVNETHAEGIFYFNEDGLIDRFEAKRYCGDALEDFIGKMEEYKSILGLLVPTRLRAIWKLKEGDFEYFKCEITSYQIN